VRVAQVKQKTQEVEHRGEEEGGWREGGRERGKERGRDVGKRNLVHEAVIVRLPWINTNELLFKSMLTKGAEMMRFPCTV